MDVYTSDNYFRIDDLLDFSNEDLFTPTITTTTTTTSTSAADHHPPPPQIPSLDHLHFPSDFTDRLSLSPCCDDVAELEWLSRFVDDSFADFPPHSSLAGTGNFLANASFSGQAAYSATFMQESNSAAAGKVKSKKKTSRATSPTAEGSVRRCTHCASEKTPQWRTGPLGPKTLCNACGVRYKSGRLVPEYRPAASPTFTMTQHSNSHRKVMELRRQKEMLMRRQHQPQDR